MKKAISTFLILMVSFSIFAQKTKQLVILHTNDVHSRIDPLPANAPRNANRGGAVRQAAYIESVRKQENAVLLLSSGDIVQGTPYFNLFKGEAEIVLMNQVKYDAACLGNHEFDYGLEALAKMIRKAQFPFIATNYDFSGTVVDRLTKTYLIIHRYGLRIGILSVGVDPEGLIAKQNYAGMKYLPPIEIANKTALFLKKEKKCDLVICLSHLGYFPAENELGDITFAKKSRNIDVILGGHSHIFLQRPDRRLNLDGKEVVISQMGKDGIYVGRLDILLEKGVDNAL